MSVPEVGINRAHSKVRVKVSLPHDHRKKVFHMLTADEADEFADRLRETSALLRTLKPVVVLPMYPVQEPLPDDVA